VKSLFNFYLNIKRQILI